MASVSGSFEQRLNKMHCRVKRDRRGPVGILIFVNRAEKLLVVLCLP